MPAVVAAIAAEAVPVINAALQLFELLRSAVSNQPLVPAATLRSMNDR